ncbi:MAG: glutamine synthetase [Enterobacterales bacterium]|jgi:glutamine synthetase
MNKIEQWLKHNNIEAVECLVPDITGTARGKLVPVDDYINETPKLSEGMLIQTVNGDYCPEHESLVSPEDQDMDLQAVEDSIRHTPWLNRNIAQVIHDCHLVSGEAHPLSTRNVLKQVLTQLEEVGLKAIIAPEVEFYLIEINDDPNMNLQPAKGKSDLTESLKQPLGIDALHEFEPFINTMYEYCKIQALNIGTLTHESGKAQLEINFQHGDPLSLADQVFTFKRTLKQAALKHNMIATFMAKPMADQEGSAMHIHQSLIDIKSGENAFANKDGSKTDLFMHYLGGLQKYTPKLISLYAPNVNSYRRFTNFMNAPISLHWGYDNRTVAFRVPVAPISATRIENRFAGMDTNPYLAIAASLASGLAGINNKLQPTAALEGDAYEEPIIITRSLDKALDCLLDMDDFDGIISSEFLNAYRFVKLKELDDYNKLITPWERENLLKSV